MIWSVATVLFFAASSLGVSHTAQVYLDGALIARHYNAYTPFSAVVRGVPAGEHTLEIVADNRFSEESALHVPNDYMSYGGISRPVSVEQVGSAYLRFLHVTPRFADGKWRAHVRVCVENLCEEASMSVQVCLAGERLVFAERTMSAGETVPEGEVTAENASPWSPASPVLYAAEARLMKNGVPFDDLIERFGFREVRSLDGSRPCSFASCKFKSDLCFGLPDVVSYNIYPLWYHDTPPAEYLADLYGWVQTTEGRGKPFLVTEIGAGGIYGFRAPYMPKWSEEYQAKALREQLGAVLSFPQCSGVYIRQFCDIRVSDEWWGGRPRTMNNKGVFDEYRRPKLCRSAVEEIFSRK